MEKITPAPFLLVLGGLEPDCVLSVEGELSRVVDPARAERGADLQSPTTDAAPTIYVVGSLCFQTGGFSKPLSNCSRFCGKILRLFKHATDLMNSKITKF